MRAVARYVAFPASCSYEPVVTTYHLGYNYGDGQERAEHQCRQQRADKEMLDQDEQFGNGEEGRGQ